MLIEKIHLEADERILLQVRRHWFVLLIRLSFPALGALLPLISLLALQQLGMWTIFYSALAEYVANPTLFLTFFYFGWLTLSYSAAFNVWTHYYLDVLTITNERIILVDQRSMFSRTVASFRLERMQDIYVDVSGMFATLLDYGTIHAETASDSTEEFRAAFIPKPREVKAVILEASDTLLHRRYTSTPDTL